MSQLSRRMTWPSSVSWLCSRELFPYRKAWRTRCLRSRSLVDAKCIQEYKLGMHTSVSSSGDEWCGVWHWLRSNKDKSNHVSTHAKQALSMIWCSLECSNIFDLCSMTFLWSESSLEVGLVHNASKNTNSACTPLVPKINSTSAIHCVSNVHSIVACWSSSEFEKLCFLNRTIEWLQPFSWTRMLFVTSTTSSPKN